MGEVYLKDYSLESRLPRKSVRDIELLLQRINTCPPTFIKQFPNGGFIVGFSQEKDVNLIIDPRTISWLEQRHLSAYLSKNTRITREIVLTDVPQYLHEESDEYIKDHLEQQNGIKIIQFIKYVSPYSRKRIIKAILDSKANHEAIVLRDRIKLGNAILPLHKSTRPAQPPPKSSKSFYKCSIYFKSFSSISWSTAI